MVQEEIPDREPIATIEGMVSREMRERGLVGLDTIVIVTFRKVRGELQIRCNLPYDVGGLLATARRIRLDEEMHEEERDYHVSYGSRSVPLIRFDQDGKDRVDPLFLQRLRQWPTFQTEMRTIHERYLRGLRSLPTYQELSVALRAAYQRRVATLLGKREFNALADGVRRVEVVSYDPAKIHAPELVAMLDRVDDPIRLALGLSGAETALRGLAEGWLAAPKMPADTLVIRTFPTIPEFKLAMAEIVRDVANSVVEDVQTEELGRLKADLARLSAQLG